MSLEKNNEFGRLGVKSLNNKPDIKINESLTVNPVIPARRECPNG